ncbi:protein toll-like [Leptopilina boulardi]|uniref:protein toll-like n=1 Tax=Leptopilina boulardi TaxID=63433 RepID=UPI0021F65BB8|nr:protein toll-like [Leptopilina boulardi]
MKNFLKLISLFLTLKMIASFDCFEYEIKNCNCYQLDNAIIQYTCIDPTNLKNRNNPKQFEISIGTFETVIKCINSASLTNFHYNFRSLLIDVSALVLENCIVNKYTDLQKIRELTAAPYIGKMNLINNFQLNDILIENPSDELNSLLGLNIENNNNLEEINMRLFHKVKNIFYLTIKKCFVQKITPNAFSELKKLLKLDLSENKLKDIYPETFNRLTTLTDLDLSGNQLEIIDNNIFQNLQQLKNLNLQNNKLTTISQFLLNQLYNLEVFNAADNLIDTIHINAFAESSKLEKINLATNNIAHLSYRNSRFVSVIMGSRKNYSLFSSCFNLKELDLSFNNIQTFYDDWIDLSEKKLISLKLSHNQITNFRLNHNFTMKSNFHIDLKSNQIRSINLFFLSTLKYETPFKMYIDARDNPIICDCLNDNLLHYIKGQMERKIYNHLDINTNNLKCNGPNEHKDKILSTLSSDNLSCEVKLKSDNNEKQLCHRNFFILLKQTVINCSNIGFTMVPNNLGIIITFDNELDFENNNLELIPQFSSEEVKFVTKLILSGNKIKNLFGINAYMNLKILKLNNNEIQDISNNDIKILNSLEKLERVTLSGNPLKCGPNFNQIKNIVKIEDRNNLTCH